MSVEVRAAAPVTTAAVSPLTYPVMVSVKVGSGAAKARGGVNGLDGEGGWGDGDLGGGGLSGVVGGVSGGEGGGDGDRGGADREDAGGAVGEGSGDGGGGLDVWGWRFRRWRCRRRWTGWAR